MSTPTTRLDEVDADLPEPILATLRAIIRRMRRVILVRGLLAVSAVALGTFLVLMAIDASITIFSPAVRWMLTLAGLAVVGLAALRFVVWPLREKVSLTAVARMVEEQHPELQERISSTVQFLSEPILLEADRPEDYARGSEQLIAALAVEASVEVKAVDPRKEISARSARPYLIAAAALAAVFGALFAIWPRQSSILLTRILLPALDPGNVHAVGLEVTPGDRIVARGDPVTIEVTSTAGDLPGAELQVIDATGHESRRSMQPATGANRRPMASLTFPSVMGDFRFRIHAGSALTAYHRITAVPRPKVEWLALRYDYPAYTGLGPRTEKDITGAVEAVAGTKLTVTAAVNKPVTKARLLVAGRSAPPPSVLTGPTGGQTAYSWSFTLALDAAGKCAVVLEDEHTFTNEPVEFEYRAIRDGAPTVAIASPKAPKLTLNTRDRVDLVYQAEDDFGILGVETLIKVDEGEPTSAPLPPPEGATQPARSRRGGTAVDLSRLDLSQARRVTVQFRVTDTLPKALGGPNRGLSQPLVIEIDRQAGSLLTQTVDAQSGQVENGLKAILQQLQQAKALSRDLPKGVEPPQKIADPVAGQVNQVRKLADDAANALRDLAKTWDATPYAALMPVAAGLADQHIVPAREAADLILLSDDPRERVDQAKQADAHIDQAITAIEKLLKDAELRSKDLRELGKLKDLAAQQQRLAEQLAQAPQGKAPDIQAREKEQQIAKALAESLKDHKDALREQLAEDRQQAKELAADAKGLAEEQKGLRQQLQALEDAKPDRAKIKQDLLKRIAEGQKDVAQKSAKLKEDLKQVDPKATEMLAEAGKAMQDALVQLGKERPEPAAEKAHEAAKDLEQLAAQPRPPESPKDPAKPPESPKDPAKPPTPIPAPELSAEAELDRAIAQDELKQTAEQLAREQKTIAEALDAVKKDALESALAQLQGGLGEKAKQLQEQAKELADKTEALALDQPSRDDAQQATSQLAEANARSDEAKNALASLAKTPDTSRPPPGEATKGEPQPETGTATKGKPSAQPGEATQVERPSQPGDAAKGEPQPETGETSKGEPSADKGEPSAEPGDPPKSKRPSKPGTTKGKPPATTSPPGEGEPLAAEDPDGEMTADDQPPPNPAAATALKAQDRNAKALDAAAKALSDLDNRLAQQAGPSSPPPDPSKKPTGDNPLASAFKNAEVAAHSQDAKQAADAARKASQALTGAANDAAERAGMPPQGPQTQTAARPPDAAPGSKPSPQPAGSVPGQGSSQEPRATPPAPVAARGPDGKPGPFLPKGKGEVDWATFGGRMKREALDDSHEGTPEDYRDLVKRYFKELSRQGGEPGEQKP